MLFHFLYQMSRQFNKARKNKCHTNWGKIIGAIIYRWDVCLHKILRNLQNNNKTNKFI
jgi:hypothetical protein